MNCRRCGYEIEILPSLVVSIRDKFCEACTERILFEPLNG